MDQGILDTRHGDRRSLIDGLRLKGIKDEEVLAALDRVPREIFLPDEYQAAAYDDVALPIGEEQTISQPFVVALMTEALGLHGTEHVLEIGTGSGFQTAVLAKLAARVTSLERLPVLAEAAGQRLRRLGYTNVEIHLADGTMGWPDQAPYEAIVVTAAAPDVPSPLIDQLALGGRLVVPVGAQYVQSLLVVTRTKSGLSRRDLGQVRFVPLIGEHGWQGERRDDRW